MKRFEEIAHTADWSFRAFGRDLRELFENAAYALFAMEGAIPADADTRAPDIQKDIHVIGMDQEALLVNWLNELLFFQDMDHVTFYRFHIRDLVPVELEATVVGMLNQKLDKLIKAVTFHDLQISQTPDGWEAVIVVDV